MNISKKKAVTISIGSVLIAVLLGYWFVMHTVRGSSLALYVVGGWHAPLSVKWDCAPLTDTRVAKKFELPLLFDEDTKNELRGFWFYSYYRQCLFDNGYDFSGNPIPLSSLDAGRYVNPYGGFSLSVPTDTFLAVSNTLDVDFHDQLLVSSLMTHGDPITVHTFLKDEEITSFEALKEKTSLILLNETTLGTTTITTNGHGVQMMHAESSDGASNIIFMTPEQHIIHISAAHELSETLMHIGESITTP